MTFVIQAPTTISSTAQIVIQPSPQMLDCIMIEIFNDTSYAFNLILPGNIQQYMAPQSAKFFAGDLWYGDAIKIYPIAVMAASSFPGLPQQLIVIGYIKGEQLPPDGTTIDLSKTVFVGNSIQVAGMNLLQSDGAGAGTTIIETTVAGQVTSNQTATNDGIWNLGVIIAGSIVKFFQTAIVDPILKLGALSHIVEVLGGLTVDQGLIIKGTSSLDNGAITTNGSGTITATLNGNASTATTATNATTAVNVATSGSVVAATGSFTGAGTGLAVTNNETVGGTLVVTGDATFNGAGNGVAVTNSANVGANLNVFGTISLTNGPGTNNRNFASIGSGDNNAHLFTNVDHGNLIVTQSGGSTAIATFNDTTGLTMTGTTTLNGAVNNKISSNNICQASAFQGTIVTPLTNTVFGHNYNSANGNPNFVAAFDSVLSGTPQTFEISTITATQVTLRSSGTGTFNAFATRV